jgi:Leucine-rich repeat (LRR) protein
MCYEKILDVKPCIMLLTLILLFCRLNFYGNAFSGKLPTELGRLTYLRALDLSENNFSGTLPTEVAKLKNITRFALHQTEGNLGGPLPAFDTFPLLKGLYLQSNSFTGQIADNFIGGIMDKKSEVIVSLASNRLVGSVPESLAAFETLILDLESNGITKLDSQLCIHDQWMRGELGRLPQISRCNAILCPPGTWNEFGKETVEEKCKECGKDTVTFGQTKCGDAQRESREKEILDGLFSMTGGRYWTKPHDNWLKPGVSVCQREGVVCSGDNGDEQHVLEIDLHDFGLRGTIPSDIWELSQVSTLRFSFNAVSVSFQGIANAKALRILDMGHCHLRNLDGMQEAPQGLAEIHLSANQFEATLPREIFELTGIVYQLFLNNNHFSGRLSSEIGKLTHLRQFYLGGNTFTGRIPSEIGLLTNLIGLGLRSNSFTSLPQEIEKLSSLVRLDLSLNQFDSQAFPSFSKNSQLVTIDASSNAFSGFLPKDLLSSVDPKARIDVNLSSNAFVGSVPESWSRFESLNLDLSDNQLTALPETLCTQNSWNGGRVGLLDTCDAILCPPGTHLTGLGRQTDPLQPCETCDEGILSAPFYGMQDCLDPKLVAERNILVSFYDATNGTSWLTQRNWLSLKPVCIWHGIVCNENGFVDSIQLEDNFLVSGPETMDDVSAILTLNELKTLDLKGNDVLLDFQTINQEMTQLEFLRLSGMGLSSLEGISNAVNLKAFHVTNNKITKIPEELYTMTSLESIFLSFNSIQGTISTKIGQLTNLKECYLFGNSLAGSIPSEIGLMTSLAEFVVAHNLLSGSLPDQISYLANLEQLSVYRQQGVELLTGPVPSFSGAPKLW